MTEQLIKYPTHMTIDLSGEHGNIFYLIGLCHDLLEQYGKPDEWQQFNDELLCKDYYQQLRVMVKWFGFMYINMP